tara:strand:- start:515 stop:1111 length:597 start_codon:yes stop_codon:yes gene_type:complete
MELLMKKEESKKIYTGPITGASGYARGGVDKTPKGAELTETLTEALNKFQQLNINAVKANDNPFFKSTYADLTSVINAVNQGAKFGLCFSQQVHYKNLILDKQINETYKDGTVKTTSGQSVTRDIYVKTSIYHVKDEMQIECDVPVLINNAEKDNPQKMGSAITYAKRYGLQALFGLGQDDDANEATGLNDKKGKQNG